DALPRSSADLAGVRRLANRARKAGVAVAAAEALRNVQAPTRDELASLLQMMIAALEASPVPKFEWAGLARVFDIDQLAALLNVSGASRKRFQGGGGAPREPVAARPHFRALVVGDLAGS